MLTVGELFAGIGGFGLGLERAGMRVRWHAEVEPYASAVLAQHWPGVPNHGDVRSIRAGSVERVDVLAGGFPCQDVANVGRRAGIDGARSGLWREFRRIAGELRPRYVLVENASALLIRGMGRVLGDLAALGFDAEWHCIPAAAVGAPHGRDRVWIVAHADGDRCEGQRVAGAGYGASAPILAGRQIAGAFDAARARGGPWESESDVGRVADGVPARVDRLRCLGNAIVPQVAEVIGRAIVEREEGRLCGAAG